MEWLLSIYIAFTVLSVLSIILDFFGLIEHHSHSSDLNIEKTFQEPINHPLSHNHLSQLDHSKNMLSPNKYREKNYLIRFFSMIRTFIYFSLGFGPSGWAAYYTVGASSSLFYSIPGGILILIIVQFLRKFIRKEMDSQMNDNELIMNQGIVIVTIPEGQIGKVRITIDGSFYDRYAMGKDPKKKYPLDSKIKVIEVEKEFLIVDFCD